MYFRIGKYFFESTEIRDGRNTSTSRAVPTLFKKVNWTTQTSPHVGTFLKDSLGQVGWKRTALKNIFMERVRLSTIKTWRQWLQMTHGGPILKDSCKIGQFLALCSHFNSAIIRNLDGLIRVKMRAKHQKSSDRMRVFRNYTAVRLF